MQLPKRRKVVAVILAIGGAVGTVVAVLSNMQTVGSYIAPPLRPYLAIVPALCFVFALLVIRHSQEVPPDGVLYRENMEHRRRIAKLDTHVAELEGKLQFRRLSEEQMRTIAHIVRKGLGDLRQSLKSSPLWTIEDAETPIFVQLYAVENDRETSAYRADFEKAFQEGGLGVALGELMGTLGYRENESFVGVVSVVRGSEKNVVRPFILEALRAARITVNECDGLPQCVEQYDHGPGGQRLGATLVIVQHG